MQKEVKLKQPLPRYHEQFKKAQSIYYWGDEIWHIVFAPMP